MGFFAATETDVLKWLTPLVGWCEPLVSRWRAPVIVTAVAIGAAFTLLLTSPSLGVIANLFLIVPLTCLILIVLLLRQRGWTKFVCLTLVCFYALTSWQLTEHWTETRTELRWLTLSGLWKDEAFRQPPQPNSGMKFIIWDGWGMIGQDTDIYLVFSPDDRLRDYSPSNLSGLPCPVWRVQRLEKQWYSVTFYTNEGWDYCGSAAR